MNSLDIVEFIKKSLNKQYVLNKIIIGDPKATEYNGKKTAWPLYAIQEIGEYLDSCDIKHWKKGDIDFDNAILELVDVWHFIMSNVIKLNLEQALNIDNEDLVNKIDNIFLLAPLDETVQRLIYLLLLLNSKRFPNKELILYDLFSVFFTLVHITPSNIDIDHVDYFIKLWEGKQILNKVRTENGYKTGEYKKTINGKEDNEYMIEYIKTQKPIEGLEEYLINLQKGDENEKSD